ncbi:hypothetical protein GCM10023194_37380 [Planotetraspora phitsanulokensis]|uniref:Uncharacterized protein n=1 Tax=Planotetraspora phitsanulokensis TaxID=575192 RepID=A0A8J3XIU4_9ACTN|nr:hypothetical protein Pph01_63040 [Planotetraspora phitsanulokensis]
MSASADGAACPAWNRPQHSSYVAGSPQGQGAAARDGRRPGRDVPFTLRGYPVHGHAQAGRAVLTIITPGGIRDPSSSVGEALVLPVEVALQPAVRLRTDLAVGVHA